MATVRTTSFNAISSAAAGTPASRIDVSARVSTTDTLMVTYGYVALVSIVNARWDVSGADTALTTAGGATVVGSNIKAFYLNDPAAGEHILRVQMEASSAEKAVGVHLFSNTNSTVPLGTLAIAANTTDDPEVTVSSTANEIVIDGLCFRSSGDVSAASSAVQGPDQTKAWDRYPNGHVNLNALSSYQTGEVSTRMSWTENFGALAAWTQIAIPVNATASAGAPASGGSAKATRLLPLVFAGR